MSKVFDPQLTGLAVGQEEIAELDACLEKIKGEVDATSLLVLDQSGQILASRNRRGGPDEVTFGALLAGTFASSRQIALVLNEHDFKTMIQLGETESFYAELISDRWIVAVVFRKQTQVGLVKVVCKKYVPIFEKIYEKAKNTSRRRDVHIKGILTSTQTNETIDLLFASFEKEGAESPSEFLATLEGK